MSDIYKKNIINSSLIVLTILLLLIKQIHPSIQVTIINHIIKYHNIMKIIQSNLQPEYSVGVAYYTYYVQWENNTPKFRMNMSKQCADIMAAKLNITIEVEGKPNYKVVGVDNFNRETVSDVLYKDNITQEEATILADKLNTEINVKYHGQQERYYKVYHQDDPLYDAFGNEH